MSSLEMLMLLELAQGRPLIHGKERDRASSNREEILRHARRLTRFGKRQLLRLRALRRGDLEPVRSGEFGVAESQTQVAIKP